MKKHSKRYARPNGFSLLEVLIALAIFALAAACSYEALRGSLLRFKSIQVQTVERRETAIALALLAKDIRTGYLDSDNPQSRFVGHVDDLGGHLDFYRTTSLKQSEFKNEPVAYFLTENRQTGRRSLQRKIGNRTIDLCRNITKFDVRYFDGSTWQDSWCWDAFNKKPYEGIRGLPLMVSIRLVVSTHGSQPLEQYIEVPVMTSFLNRMIRV